MTEPAPVRIPVWLVVVDAIGTGSTCLGLLGVNRWALDKFPILHNTRLSAAMLLLGLSLLTFSATMMGRYLRHDD